MKNANRIVSCLLAILMVGSLCIEGFAAEISSNGHFEKDMSQPESSAVNSIEEDTVKVDNIGKLDPEISEPVVELPEEGISSSLPSDPVIPVPGDPSSSAVANPGELIVPELPGTDVNKPLESVITPPAEPSAAFLAELEEAQRLTLPAAGEAVRASRGDAIVRLEAENAKQLEQITLANQLIDLFGGWSGERIRDDYVPYIEALSANPKFGSLRGAQKSAVAEALSVDVDQLVKLEKQGCDISEVIDWIKFGRDYGVELSAIAGNSYLRRNKTSVEGQLQYYNRKFPVAPADDLIFKQYILQGHELDDVILSYVAEKELGTSMGLMLSDAPVAKEGQAGRQSSKSAESTGKVQTEKWTSFDAAAKEECMSSVELRNALLGSETMTSLMSPMAAAASTSTPSIVDPGEMTYGEASFIYNRNDNEQINVNTGSLVLRYTDLHLPGANGLDLTLTRRYDLSKSNTRNPYPTAGRKYTGNGYRMFYEVETTDNYYVQNMYNLGYGWQFELPFIEIVDSYKGTTTSYRYDPIKHLNLGNGSSYEIKITPDTTDSNLVGYDYVDIRYEEHSGTLSHTTGGISYSSVLYQKDGTNYYFYNNYRLAAIKDRYDNIIKFTYTLTGASAGYPGTLTEMRIEDTLGRIVLFQKSGNNMVLRVQDGVSNPQITYSLSDSKLMLVTDLGGRMTRYDYAPQTARCQFFGYDDDFGTNVYWGNTITYNAISRIEHPTGASTNYTFERSKMFYGRGKTGCGNRDNANGYHRTDGSNCVDKHGWRDFYRVKTRYDQQNPLTATGIGSAQQVDYETYTYSAEENYTGYPLRYGYSWNGYTTTVTDSKGVATVYRFNGSISSSPHTPQQVTTSHNGQVISLVTSSYTNNLLMSQTVYGYGGNTMAATTSYIYDSSKTKDITKITYPSGLTANMSYEPTYHQMTQRLTNVGTATVLGERHVISSGGKAPTRVEVYGGPVSSSYLKSATDYAYNSMGSVTSERRYYGSSLTNTAQSYMTYYDYGNHGISSRFAGAFPSAVRMIGVQGHDGSPIDSPHGSGTVKQTYKYDWYGRIVEMGHPNDISAVAKVTYDRLGRKTRETNYNGTYHTTTYNDTSNTVVTTDENGSRMTYSYNPMGQIARVTDNTTNKLLYFYSYDNRLNNTSTAVYGENGLRHTFSYGYDYRNRPTSSQVKSGSTVIQEITYSYSDAYQSLYDRILKTLVGDTNGASIRTTTYTDHLGRTVKEGYYIGSSEYTNVHTYNEQGNRIQTLTALDASRGLGYTAKWEYDHAGRPVKETNALGHYSLTTYDPLGRVATFKDYAAVQSGNANYVTRYTYDALGRVLTQQTPFQLSGSTVTYSTTRYTYDPSGNVLEQEVSDGMPGSSSYRLIGYEYNLMGRMTHTLSYDEGSVASVARYTYNNKGNILTLETGLSDTDSNDGKLTRYAYNYRGQVTRVTDALGQESTSTYDAGGLMTGSTDRNGNETTYTYDAVGRLLTTRTVDTGGNVTSITTTYTKAGHVRTSGNGTATSTYTYDDLGRVKTQVDSDVTKTYTYDIGSNRTGFKLQRSSATVIDNTYTYDNLNRLTVVKASGSEAGRYTYDIHGNRASLTHANGVVTTYSYNLANLVTSLQNKKGSAILSAYVYTYYLDGNQATKTDHNNVVTSYAYDGLGRLEQEARSDENTMAYAFDRFGNRASLTVTNTGTGVAVYTTTYTYDAGNRLLTDVKQEGVTTHTTTYTYDANGNQLTYQKESTAPAGTAQESGLSFDGNLDLYRSYSYNGFNQLISAYAKGAEISYTYNPDGLRRTKTVNGVTTQHLWDGSNMVAEVQNSVVTAKYIRGMGLLSSVRGGETRYFLHNAHGDVVQLTDTSGQIVWVYDYDAFGNQKDVPGYDSKLDTNPFRYCGEYFDEETGSIYLRARYYNPIIGRFIGEDPIRDSLNWYTYCDGNPAMYIDPLGLAAWVVHGTFSDPDTWTDELITYLGDEVFVDEFIDTPEWTGGNSKEAREQAANEIVEQILAYHADNPDEPIRLVGHSHGGNVSILIANKLAQQGIKVETLITIATPVREYQLTAEVGQHLHIYNNADIVQWAGGEYLHVGIVPVGLRPGRRTFINATNVKLRPTYYVSEGDPAGFESSSHVRPIYSHSYMHSNIDVWQEHIAPLII